MKRKNASAVEKRSARPSALPAGRKACANRRPDTPLYVVGLGSSAGGLEAYEEFFTHLAAESGLAFIVVAHLHPDRKGIMPELLQRYTRMKVCQAQDGMRVRGNRVYVIPPNADLSILHGMLQLLEPAAPRGLRMPIDYFFKHLAQDQQDRSVGIILSGMGTDGTQGLKAIKEQSGLTMVQEPASAKCDSMPCSAIGTGLVDVVARAADLPAKLLDLVKRAGRLPARKEARQLPPSRALEKIFVLLRGQSGVDFSVYKPATIRRRIERRMSVHQVQTLPLYTRYLQANPQELDLLFRELLIGVTNFFRDPEAFRALKEKAVCSLLKHKGRGVPVRVWVPGCSTGEEAYSVAIVLAECLEEHQRREAAPCQIFATDLDKDAIDKARQATFPANIAAAVSPERLQRYFMQREHTYILQKRLRDQIVFATHNLLTDPPFTKLDLICCRNLLIYLNAEVQRKMLELFHYALNPGGILFLGAAETVGSLTSLFTPLQSRWRIFERKAAAPKSVAVPELTVRGPLRPVGLPGRAAPRAVTSEGEIAEAAQRLLLDHYVPPAVVIRPQGDIVYIVGRTGKYLEPASGKVNLNIFAMAREGLRLELSPAIRRAVEKKTTVTVEHLKVRSNGSELTVRLVIRPLREAAGAPDLLLVLFEDSEPALTPGRARAVLAKSPRQGVQIRVLERELVQTKEDLRRTVIDMEAAQEGLTAANEELQSNNEELQSTNEELTTSKEELQSLNEEMSTVNSELQTRIDELAQINSDVNNLLKSIDVATIITDNELRIRRFTPQATRIFNLIPTDVGRPLNHLVSNLRYAHLAEEAQEVLSSLVFREAQVQTTDDHWHLMRIVPYRTAENVISGLLFTFVDITPLKQLEASLRASQRSLKQARVFIDSMIAAVGEPLVVLDAELRIVSVNLAFCQAFRATAEAIERRPFCECCAVPSEALELRRRLQDTLANKSELNAYEIEMQFPGAGRRALVLNARHLDDPDQHLPLILLTVAAVAEAPAGGAH